MQAETKEIVKATERWLLDVVIGLNLCPFAHAEHRRQRIRFQVSKASSADLLLQDLVIELALLNKQPEIETTLLIHPQALLDFADYNQFLDFADRLLQEMKLVGTYQIASFHPDYCFAGTQYDDAENYSNRSPYPMLHILRESSVERAVASHENADDIPVQNIDRLNKLGTQQLKNLLRACYENI